MSEPMDFAKDDGRGDGSTGDVVRQQSWPCDRAAELELTVDVGRIRVELVAGGDEVRVEVRHEPGAGGTWAQGLGGLINWLGSGLSGGGLDGGTGGQLADVANRAVRAAEITWSEGGRRLVVRSSEELPMRVVPLAVTVTAPEGSRVAARTGSGDVTVGGTAGWAAVRTGSGEVGLDAVDGDADVTTGSGGVRLGPVAGRARVRTGSGEVRLAALHGPAEVRASSGDVVVEHVAADLGVRTGSGEIVVRDAGAGRLDLGTGSGDLRIGVHAGVVAELDLSSGSGRARSELEVHTGFQQRDATLTVKGRTGSGDVLVTRSTVPAA